MLWIQRTGVHKYKKVAFAYTEFIDKGVYITINNGHYMVCAIYITVIIITLTHIVRDLQ